MNTRVIYFGLLVLSLCAAQIGASHAASISTNVTAGRQYVTYNGGGAPDLAGPDFTQPSLTENNNASSYEMLVTDWQGDFIDGSTGSSYGQTVYAAVQVGHLQTVSGASSAVSVNEDRSVFNSTSSTSAWQDTLTLTSVGVASGYMSFDLELVGWLNANTTGSGGGEWEEEPGYWFTWNTARAGWQLDVQMTGGALINDTYGGYVGSFDGDANANLPLVVSYSAIPIQFGVPVTVSVSLTADADNNYVYQETAAAEVSILNSLEWGGITSVVDADGNPIDFSLVSDSGYDYRLAFADSPEGRSVVPLPAAFWLFGSGLLGLVGIARRQKPKKPSVLSPNVAKPETFLKPQWC